MLRSFDGIAVRQIRTRRLRAFLTTGGIVLGVAMMLGVLLLTGTIKGTFRDFYAGVYGRTDLVVLGRSAIGTLPEQDLGTLAAVPGVAEAQGVVTGNLQVIGADGKVQEGDAGTLQTAAVDPAARDQSGLRYLTGGPATGPGQIVVDERWAAAHGLHAGQRLVVVGPDGRRALRLSGIFAQSSGALGDAGRARIALPSGRSVLGVPRGYSELRLVADGGTGVDALAQRVRRALPAGAKVQTPRGRSDDVAKQLQTLDVALLFFGGTALFVGGYLILNAFNMTVLQRMRELGMLRTLGASRGMLLRSVLLEAFLLGIVGTVLGVGLGFLVASGMLRLVGAAFALPAGTLVVSGSAVLVAALAGILTSLAGALRPAWRAAQMSPMRALHGGDGERRAAPGWRRGALGVALFLPGLLAGGSFWFGDRGNSATGQVLGLLSMVALFVGLALLAPFIVLPIARLLGAPLSRLSPAAGRLAGDAIAANPRRTAATAATLMIGLSVVVVNGAMTSSFVGSVRDQLDRSALLDLSIQPRGWSPVTTSEQVSATLARRVAALPGAGVVTGDRSLYVELPGARPKGTQNGVLHGIDPALYPLVDGGQIDQASRRDAYAGLATDGVILDGAYARQAGLAVGERLRLSGPNGTRTLRVTGVARALAFGLPSAWVSNGTLDRTYGPGNASRLLVRAAQPADRQALARAVTALLARERPDLRATSLDGIKREYDRQINQQFGFFNAIVAVAVLISLLGIVNALTMSVLERRREIGVLRALGSSRSLVARTMVDEGLLVTTAGAAGGAAVGILIGWAWVEQARSLFPQITFHLPVGTVITVMVAAVVLGALAAALPAVRAARTQIMEAIGYE